LVFIQDAKKKRTKYHYLKVVYVPTDGLPQVRHAEATLVIHPKVSSLGGPTNPIRGLKYLSPWSAEANPVRVISVLQEPLLKIMRFVSMVNSAVDSVNVQATQLISTGKLAHVYPDMVR
jgi:hypothetical protein